MKSRHIFKLVSGTILCGLLLLATESGSALASEKWQGVDESVVEKYAAEHGRTAREPYINTDQGDLLLFVFLLAGVAGGFAAGYFWRMLVAEKGPGRAAATGENGKSDAPA